MPEGRRWGPRCRWWWRARCRGAAGGRGWREAGGRCRTLSSPRRSRRRGWRGWRQAGRWRSPAQQCFCGYCKINQYKMIWYPLKSKSLWKHKPPMSQFIKLREVIKIQLSGFSIFKRVENLLREKGSLFTDFKQMNITRTTAATLLAKLRVLETRKHSKEAYLALFLAGYTLNFNLN